MGQMSSYRSSRNPGARGDGLGGFRLTFALSRAELGDARNPGDAARQGPAGRGGVWADLGARDWRANRAIVAFARVIHAPADPLVLARVLLGAPGLAVLASRPAAAPRPEDARYSFVACDPIDASEALAPPGVDGGASEPAGAPEPAWIGVVPYEGLRAIERPGWTRDPDDRPPCTLARPAWRRYAAVVRIDHATGEVAVVGDDARSLAALAERIGDGVSAVSLEPPVLRAGPLEGSEASAHLERIREALRLIAAGDLYEINVARRIPVAFQGDVLALFTLLLDSAPAPWGFLQDLGETLVLASSPELALSVQGSALRTCPIKGTRPRGRDAAEDERLARELEADPKEQAELTMAVDVHRNDLGRVAVAGSVHVLGAPRVLGGRTVWSRVAEVVATRRPGCSIEEVMRAVLPGGSVTGAPKVRAMEVIARLEPWRRGLYTGAFGYAGRGPRLELAMAIRTLQLERAGDRGWQGDYFSGAASSPTACPSASSRRPAGRRCSSNIWAALRYLLVRMSLAVRVRDALISALESIGLGEHVDAAAWSVERPKRAKHGDLATNVAMALTKKAGKPPRKIAEELVAALAGSDVIASADVAGPGFVNLRLHPAVLQSELAEILRAGRAWGRAPSRTGERIDSEFVSANPTGPVTVGSGRNAILGDAVARLLEATGCHVTREYYVNDRGNQVRKFAESVLAAHQGREPPEDGYKGAYVAELAAWLARVEPAILAGDIDSLGRVAVATMLRGIPGSRTLPGIRPSLADLRIWFDVFSSDFQLLSRRVQSRGGR